MDSYEIFLSIIYIKQSFKSEPSSRIAQTLKATVYTHLKGLLKNTLSPQGTFMGTIQYIDLFIYVISLKTYNWVNL